MQENLSTEIPLPTAHNFINRTGKTYGLLTVIRYAGKTARGRTLWECKCECGNVVTAIGSELSDGHTTSCKCRRMTTGKLNRTHGYSRTRIYGLWSHVIRRCYSLSSKAYNRYGGRGITVCERWRKFENFYADMGERPVDRTLDRIDNDGGYWCGKCDECTANGRQLNCRWATRVEQGNNKRNNRMITYQGVTLTLAQWATKFGLDREIVRVRLRRGWSVEDALERPLTPNDSSRRKRKQLISL